MPSIRQHIEKGRNFVNLKPQVEHVDEDNVCVTPVNCLWEVTDIHQSGDVQAECGETGGYVLLPGEKFATEFAPKPSPQ